MRVIAGQFKGRQLKSVPGKATRPTTDKIKEAVYQMIGPFFNGGYCLDLYAGRGALGIEAISRGIDHAIFLAKESKAIHTIQRNMDMLHITDETEVFRVDAFRAMKAVARRGLNFKLILLAPPYQKVNYEKVLNKIVELDLLESNGLIYCEYELNEKIPEHIEKLNLIKKESYGKTTGISIYKKGDI